ncbi:MAG: hypothetical protein KC996_01770 [Phycisphaerales bacterium]|nr:hypothetical protein [Phycisphaerales bacterium]
MAKGTRFVLPRRAVPFQVRLGLAMVFVCLLVIAALFFFSKGFWLPPLRVLMDSGIVRPGLALLLAPLIPSLMLCKGVRMGLLIAYGHTEVEVTNDELVSIDRWGMLRSKHRIRVRDIKRLIIKLNVMAKKGEFDKHPWRDMKNLLAEREHENINKIRVALAMGYPPATIEAIASEIIERTGVPIEELDPEHDSLMDLMRGEPEKPETIIGVLSQPKQSNAEFVQNSDGFTITLRPRGFWRGTKGFGSFALMWCGFVLVMSIFFGVAALRGKNSSTDWVFMSFLGVFWIVGGSMLFFAIRSGRRRAVIDVVEGALLVTRQSIGKPRSNMWALSDIERIEVGNSGTEINDVPVKELQVFPIEGRKVGLLSERPNNELRWIASLIRQRLAETQQGGPE